MGIIVLVLLIVIHHDWWPEFGGVNGESYLDGAEVLMLLRLLVIFDLEGSVKVHPDPVNPYVVDSFKVFGFLVVEVEAVLEVLFRFLAAGFVLLVGLSEPGCTPQTLQVGLVDFWLGPGFLVS